jgi:intermediate peptidase
MLDMKTRSPFGTTKGTESNHLQVWDVSYLTGEARNKWLNLNVSSITEYFSLGVCMEGLNMLYSKLFKVSLEVEDSAPGELWHSDVYKLAVRDLENGGSLMGYIYCDFFSREGKPFQVRL